MNNMDKPKLFNEQMNNDTYNVLTNEQLHTLTKVMSGLGAPNEIDDTGWCKDTWGEGNELAAKPSLNDVDAERAAYILYKFADTQLPSIGSNNGFGVDSKIMWATRQSFKLSIIRYADNFGNRIALMGWFDTKCNKELREQLKWPKCQWVTNDKIDGWPDDNEATGAWTIQDDPNVISVALDVLNKYGFNFTNLLSVKDNTTIINGSYIKDGIHHGGIHTGKPMPKKIDKRYKAVLNIDAVELHWPFLKNNNDIRTARRSMVGNGMLMLSVGVCLCHKQGRLPSLLDHTVRNWLMQFCEYQRYHHTLITQWIESCYLKQQKHPKI
jgi:hypothetical protein